MPTGHEDEIGRAGAVVADVRCPAALAKRFRRDARGFADALGDDVQGNRRRRLSLPAGEFLVQAAGGIRS